MTTELKTSENTDLNETLQRGELIVGFSSAIPGFIKKSSDQNAISFAPFYMREHWVKLPTAVIQQSAPVSGGSVQKRVAFTLRPGNENVLIDILGALAENSSAHRNGAARTSLPFAPFNCQSGICCSCQQGDENCVNCYLV